MPSPVPTLGAGQASVEGESVTNEPDSAASRLPSTGAAGAGGVAVLAGGLLVAGGLMLAARRRMPATADVID